LRENPEFVSGANRAASDRVIPSSAFAIANARAAARGLGNRRARLRGSDDDNSVLINSANCFSHP